MTIINMFRVGIQPPQPLFFTPYFLFGISLFLLPLLCIPGKEVRWWYSNHEHVYDFHELGGIKLLKTERNQNQIARGFPVLGHIGSMS